MNPLVDYPYSLNIIESCKSSLQIIVLDACVYWCSSERDFYLFTYELTHEPYLIGEHRSRYLTHV